MRTVESEALVEVRVEPFDAGRRRSAAQPADAAHRRLRQRQEGDGEEQQQGSVAELSAHVSHQSGILHARESPAARFDLVD
jgi:hypothetical protein